MINKSINYGLNLLVFLLPLFFLPLTTNFYEFNKNFLLFLTVIFLYLVWAIKITLKKEIKLSRTLFDLPLIFLVLAFIFAAIFVSSNKIEAILTPGTTGTMILLTLFYFLITHHFSVISKRLLVTSLIASGAILGLIAVYQFLGIGEAYAPASWLKSKTWTPAGGPLPLITILVIAFPLAVNLFLKKIQKSFLAACLFGFATVLIFAGLTITIFQILPGKPNAVIILPYLTSWAIAIEAFKQSPLFGVGPANFLTAFNRFRPLAFNNYPFWTARFDTGSIYPLQLLTTTGIFGLIAFIWLVINILRYKNIKNVIFWCLLIDLGLLFLLPVNLLSLFIFFLLLADWAPKEKETIFKLRKMFWLPLALFSVLLVLGSYFATRVYLAEYYFKKSLTAAAKNDGLSTYNFQIKAISLNPKNADYHLIYSQTNLVLANALVSKPDLTDEEKKKISQLVNQAIREAKITTALGPKDARSWENLASIYQGLINFAQEADKWAILSYQQAILNDPGNPRLRLTLGSLFYALKNFDPAVQCFQDAVNLKPDYANGYYNLAAAYKELKKYPEAYQALQNTLNLLPANSADWQKTKNEIDELAKLLPAAQTGQITPQTESGQTELTQPQALPSPQMKPPIELPQESTPLIASPTPAY